MNLSFISCSYTLWKLKKNNSIQHLKVGWGILIFCSESLISCTYPLWKFKKKKICSTFKHRLGIKYCSESLIFPTVIEKKKKKKFFSAFKRRLGEVTDGQVVRAGISVT